MKVSIVKCENYEQERVERAVRKSLELINFQKNPKTVLVKPNILQAAAPEKAISTHPSVVRAVCSIFKNSDITIAESPGPVKGDIFRESGIQEVADEFGIKTFKFEMMKLRKISTESRWLGEIYLPEILFETDLIVNLSKLKTHALTKYTGAVKNIFGVVPGGRKQYFHKTANTPEKFSEMIADLYNVVRPGLNIMDGIVGMEGNGPANGRPVQTGIILASENAVALDIAAADIIGMKDVLTTKFCLKKGYFKENIERVGEIDFKLKYEEPLSVISNLAFLQSLIKKRVSVNKNACKKCGICREHCPIGAIDENYNIGGKCILCFCCLEMCPNNAVEIKTNFFGKCRRIAKKIFFRD